MLESISLGGSRPALMGASFSAESKLPGRLNRVVRCMFEGDVAENKMLGA